MMRKALILTISLLSALNCLQARNLVIIHTNDTHSQIEPVRTGYGKGMGGVERRLQLVNSIRDKYGKKNVLFLDAGDFNQGTPYYTMGHGDLEIELCNVLKIDVAALGNHEFDNGQEDLARRLAKARHKTVTCNYDFTGTPLEKYVKPWVIVRRAGLKIGIIGATSYLESSVMKSGIEGLKRLDTVAEINRWADYLKNTCKCDIVILLSHLGYQGGSYDRPSDIFIAGHSRNLDLIVGGHSHTFLKSAKEVKDLDGKVIPITQCGGQGTVVGLWEISFD